MLDNNYTILVTLLTLLQLQKLEAACKTIQQQLISSNK